MKTKNLLHLLVASSEINLPNIKQTTVEKMLDRLWLCWKVFDASYEKIHSNLNCSPTLWMNQNVFAANSMNEPEFSNSFIIAISMK